MPCTSLAVALIVTLSFVLTFAASFVLRKYLVARQIMDIPNGRSMHTTPTPRGGGLAVMMILLAGFLPLALSDAQPGPLLWIFGALLLLVCVSWYDDKHDAPVALRLGTHLVAAAMAVHALPEGALILGGFVPLWIDHLMAVLALALFMNMYNFMDGIDGMAGTETFFLATGIGLVFVALGQDTLFTTALTALMAGSALGFLALNWHPAKLFLGDVGSVPLGLLTGILLLHIAATGHLVTALILPLYYLADSGLTLLKRAARREKIWQAHREHFYQKATAAVGRPDRIVLWVATANAALIGAGLVALANPVLGATGAVLIVAFLLTKMHKSSSTQPQKM